MLSAAVALLAAGPLCDEARAKAAAFPRGVCPHIPASTLAALRRAVLEYDRVLRPGGYFVQVGWKLATKFSVFASDAGANAARTLIERARPRGKEEERRWIDDPVYAEEAWVDQILSKWREAGADAPTSGEPAAAVAATNSGSTK